MRDGSVVLDLDCLRTFVTIVDEGSFSIAAGAVGRTPSAVSMQIKKLEAQLGVSLFNRDSRSVVLTRDGEKLLSRARRILSLSNEAVAQFVTPELQGRVKFGAPHDLAERVLPNILRSLESNYPSITVDVTADTSEGLLRRAERGDLDLALINFAKGSGNPPGELLAEEDTVWVGAGAAAHTDATRCRWPSMKMGVFGEQQRLRNLKSRAADIGRLIYVPTRCRNARRSRRILPSRRSQPPTSAARW